MVPLLEESKRNNSLIREKWSRMYAAFLDTGGQSQSGGSESSSYDTPSSATFGQKRRHFANVS